MWMPLPCTLNDMNAASTPYQLVLAWQAGRMPVSVAHGCGAPAVGTSAPGRISSLHASHASYRTWHRRKKYESGLARR
jgi:hypothetical protein